MALRRFGPEMDEGLLPAPQVPAEEQDVSSLLLRQLFGLMGDRRAGADREAASAREALQTAEATPAQTINPLAEGAARGLARVGNVLSRGKSGGGIGGEIAARKSAFEMARKDNLNRLRQTYEAAAERAMQMGDNETETKVRVAINQLDKQYKAERDAEQEQLKRDLAADVDKRIRDLHDAGALDRETLEELKHRQRLLEIGAKGDEARATQREKPLTTSQLRAKLIEKGAKGLMEAEAFEKRRAEYAGTLSKRKINKNAARENLRSFDLNYRKLGETPEQFVGRLAGIKDPLAPKKDLYSNEDIIDARNRLFTEDELVEE